MRKIIKITGADLITDVGSNKTNPLLTNLLIEGPEEMQISDGSHTIEELYDHRYVLWIALCMHYDGGMVWRSRNHSDGIPAFSGDWFLLGMHTHPGLQISYHLPISMWDKTDFAETLDKAPEWDGHTAADVLERIKNL